MGWWDYEVNIIWFTELKMLRVISICGVLDIVSTKLRQVLTASLAPANKTGICDQDYRGEYIVALHNHSNIPQMITHGDRSAQMAVVPFWQADFEEVSELDETERGAGGFGSTGKQ